MDRAAVAMEVGGVEGVGVEADVVAEGPGRVGEIPDEVLVFDLEDAAGREDSRPVVEEGAVEEELVDDGVEVVEGGQGVHLRLVAGEDRVEGVADDVDDGRVGEEEVDEGERLEVREHLVDDDDVAAASLRGRRRPHHGRPDVARVGVEGRGEQLRR